MQKLMKKIVVGAVALSMVVAMVPGLAQGATLEELTVLIAELTQKLTEAQAQLTALQGGTTTVTGCTITSFDRNLKQTMTGDDVKCLQIVLNTATDTQVASTGAGSPGSETSYFGSLTKAAVIKFQEKYASEVLASWGLTAGTGFVGTTTRAKLDTLLGVVVPTPTPTGTETPTPTATPVGAGLTVALASDTPATSTLVGGQSLALLAKFTFTNGDASEVKVTQVKLKRLGVSADTTLSNVYLFEGASRLTDSASVSSGVITFSDSTGLLTVSAGGSKTVTVYSDIALVTGETVGVGITASTDVTSTASAVNGTFPLNGNLMSIASATLAGVCFANSTTPSATDVSPQNDYTVWQNIVVVTTRAVNFTRLSLREIGTIASTDLQNFRLYVDGVQVGSTVQNLDSNGYITFDLSAAPKKLEAGSRTIKVLGDIIGGSNRTFSFHVRVAADGNFVDTQYGVNVLPTANNGVTCAGFTSRYTGDQEVSSGTLTIEKTTDSPSGNIVNGATNATLAKYTLTAAGEKVKIETLYVSVAVADTNGTNKGGITAATVEYLRNGMLLANGVQIGSTSNLYEDNYSPTYTTFNLGSSLIVEPGSPVTLEVRADIYDADADNNLVAGDTITATLRDIGNPTGNNNATGLTSLTTIDVPSDDYAGNQLTIAAGSLVLSKYTAYVDQTFAVPLTAAKLAHFKLTAGTSEAVNVNTITVDFDQVSGSFDASDDLTNVYVAYGDKTTTVKPILTTDAGHNWSINYQLAAGASIDVVLYANVGSGAYVAGGDADLVITDMTITGVTVDSATTVNSGEIHGQAITFSAGGMIAAGDAGTPIPQIVAGSSAADVAAGTYKTVTAAKFQFTALVDDFTIRELKVKVADDVTSAALIGATLKDATCTDGTTDCLTKSFDTASNTTAYFTGLNVSVPANTNKVLTVDLILSQPSASAATSQKDVKVTMDWFKYANSQGVESIDPTDYAGNSLYVYQSIPVFTVLSLPPGQGVNLASGATTLYKFKVAADEKGEIALKQMAFSITITDGNAADASTLSTFRLTRGISTPLTGLVTIQNAAGDSLEEATTTIGEGTSVVVVTFDTEEMIAAGQYYEYSLSATPLSFTSNTNGSDSVSTSLLGDAAAHNGTDVFVYDPAGTGSIFQLASTVNNSDVSASAYSVIWSDVSSRPHSYTSGASSTDWANGYLVLDLPLDSKGIVTMSDQ